MSLNASPYVIREAVPTDAEAIAYVHVKSWQTSYRSIIDQSYLDNISYEQRLNSRKEILKSKDILRLVVIFEKKIIGFVNAGPLRPKPYNAKLSLFKAQGLKQGEIYAIYFLKEHQGKGLGRKLYKHCRHWFGAHDFQQFVTWGLADNAHASRFYESEGGKIVGEITITIGDKDYKENCYLFENV